MTEPTRALMLRPELTPSTWEMIQAIAPVIYRSRLFGMHSAEEASAVMLKGHELGLGLTASFEFVQVVMGKPALSPRGCLALIHGASHLIEAKIEESTAQTCTVWMRRKDTGFEFRRTWTIENATRAGVVKPDSGWTSYPENMLLWRTVGFVADVVCPDLIGGLKRADELGAEIDREGNVIDGTWATAAPVPASAPPAGPTLVELTEKYGAETVFAACGGILPATAAGLAELASGGLRDYRPQRGCDRQNGAGEGPEEPRGLR